MNNITEPLPAGSLKGSSECDIEGNGLELALYLIVPTVVFTKFCTWSYSYYTKKADQYFIFAFLFMAKYIVKKKFHMELK